MYRTILPRPRRAQLILAAAALLACGPGWALGVDKLLAELDVSPKFRSTAPLMVFNDSDRPVYVAAQGMTWDVDPKGQFITGPTADLEILPSIQRVPAGGSARFRLRYKGEPLAAREATYRVMFKELPIPDREQAGGGPDAAPAPAMSVSPAFTIPVYVSDFTVESDVLQRVRARFTWAEGQIRLQLDNEGDRHVIVKELAVDGEIRPGVGPVLAHRSREFQVPARDRARSVDVTLGYRDQTRTIRATEAP